MYMVTYFNPVNCVLLLCALIIKYITFSPSLLLYLCPCVCGFMFLNVYVLKYFNHVSCILVLPSTSKLFCDYMKFSDSWKSSFFDSVNNNIPLHIKFLLSCGITTLYQEICKSRKFFLSVIVFSCANFFFYVKHCNYSKYNISYVPHKCGIMAFFSWNKGIFGYIGCFILCSWNLFILVLVN